MTKLPKKPKVRRDKLCAVCKEKEVPFLAREQDDPFCSNVCARKFYGFPLKESHVAKTHGRTCLCQKCVKDRRYSKAAAEDRLAESLDTASKVC